GASLLAAVFLVIGIIRGRPRRRPVAASTPEGGGPAKPATWAGAASAWPQGDDAVRREEPPVAVFSEDDEGQAPTTALAGEATARLDDTRRLDEPVDDAVFRPPPPPPPPPPG